MEKQKRAIKKSRVFLICNNQFSSGKGTNFLLLAQFIDHLPRSGVEDGTAKQHMLRVGILKVEVHLELLGFIATTDNKRDCQDCED